ncbi:MAG: radical SAM protein, partial [Alphaproteobacteria bacterium]|nr:radical SAM protein [Alphaproteobacteria bacterium]
TLCHRIPGFIEKASKAGVRRVFIGLENINPDNLLGAKKHQNKITEYRTMLQQWHDAGAITYAGYITGFPGDTKDSILRDVEIIKRELPVDVLEFFFLTPLPGSEDHKKMWLAGAWMDPDLNKYDLDHPVARHPKMSPEEWGEAYRAAWDSFYSDDHVRTILRRIAANPRGRTGTTLSTLLWFRLMVAYEDVHPLEGGAVRCKSRRDRRFGLPVEGRTRFYTSYLGETASKVWRYWRLYRRWNAIHNEVRAAPDRFAYSDIATAPQADELETLDLYHATSGGEAALARKRRDDALRARQSAGAALPEQTAAE